MTKVFRSKDYNSLLYVLKNLFNKVEVSKPQASRMQSAEIFIVCTGFKAPDTIDPKFLDPKFAFEEIEEELDSNKQITSLKKLLETKRNRSGYGDKSATLYQETDLMDFFESEDPYLFLSTYNKVSTLFNRIHPLSMPLSFLFINHTYFLTTCIMFLCIVYNRCPFQG